MMGPFSEEGPIVVIRFNECLFRHATASRSSNSSCRDLTSAGGAQFGTTGRLTAKWRQGDLTASGQMTTFGHGRVAFAFS